VPRTPAQQLEVLRRFRSVRGRDVSIGGEVERVRRGLTRERSALGGLDSAWEDLAPPDLAPRVRVVRLSPGGVATLAATDAAAAYEADVWLRSGGLARLRSRCTSAIRRARVVTQERSR
jgi:hypothetical protein